MGEPTKIVGNGREASSGGIMLPSLVQSWKNFPHACGRVEKRCVQAVRTWNFLMKNNFQVFSQCDKKTSVSTARNTILLNFELAHAVRQNDTFKMPSQHEKCKNTLGFKHSTLRMTKKTRRQFQGGESPDSLVLLPLAYLPFAPPSLVSPFLVKTNSPQTHKNVNPGFIES